MTTRNIVRIGLLAAGMWWGGAGTAFAQTFAPLTGLKAGTTLVVTDDGGRRVKGELRQADAGSLTIAARGRAWTFRPSEVQRVVKRDGIWNGLAIGVAAGAFTAMLVTTSDCKDDSECLFYESVAFYPLFTGGGAAIGALLDGMTNRVMFNRASGRAQLVVQPARRGASVGVRVSF